MITIQTWSELTGVLQSALLRRPNEQAGQALHAQVAMIADTVRVGGDAALRAYTLEFDQVDIPHTQVTDAEFTQAHTDLSADAIHALQRAIDQVRRFHEAQITAPICVQTSPGVTCELLTRPLNAVGLYVPAGRAPLPSAAIMLAVPAAIAGCPTRILCTPPRRDGRADPAVLVAAQLAGITHVFKVGGAQAIAAMAYGTSCIPKVDKVFGPGNAYVTAAKMHVANDPAGAALDLPAGPSEVLVIADDSAHPEFVAADLLAQAEHDPASQVILLTPSHDLAQQVASAIERQRTHLSRHAIIDAALSASRLIVVADLATAILISNTYAPEHLILHTENARAVLAEITTAGSVFIGPWSPESVGDYCSGTNHVLPTYGYARAYSGLSLADFSRRMSVQELTPHGLADIGPIAMTLASLEGLDAHAQAIAVRLRQMETR
jgi:histidinol dehydrogenase